jgi:hypothetical protein
MLALCFSLILATASCNKVKPRLASASMDLYIYDTSVSFYHTDAFSKNKKQEIILAFWDNMPRPAKFESGPNVMEDLPKITCFLTKSNPPVKFECVGEFDVKTGKGTVNIAGKTFDISNGRLFLINIYEKPLKVIQINEQFNLPPFNNLPSLDDLSFTKKSCLNAFSSCEKKFKYLAKNNKIVAAFLADIKKSSDSSKNKSKDKKKDN